jgi:hypothetical protein
VQRRADIDAMADALADDFVAIRRLMIDGRMTPQGVHEQILDFTPEKQVAKAYDNHRRIQDRLRDRRQMASRTPVSAPN